MTWENENTWWDSLSEWLNNTDFARWLMEIKGSMISSANSIWQSIWDVTSSIFNAFMMTPLGKICWFIWGIVEFIYYAVRSILLLLWWVLNSFLNWFTELFWRLLWTFNNLSVFMWSSVSLLINLFLVVFYYNDILQ